MKIAVTSTGPTLDDQVEARFGRCPYFLVVDTDSMQFEAVENPNISLGGGAGIQSAQMMAESGVSYVLTGNCGPNAFQVFGQVGVQVVVGVSGPVRKAVEDFKSGKLTSATGPSVQSHFGVGGGQQPGAQSPTAGGPPQPATGPGMGMGPGMGRGMGRGGGRGRGMGGGRGMGMGLGRGQGMGAAMPGGAAGIGGGPPATGPVSREEELASLKQQAEALKQQKQQVERRIAELQSGRKAVAFVQAEKCTACGICADVCPVNAITIEQHAVVNPELCTACAACVSECPNGAIVITQYKRGS